MKKDGIPSIQDDDGPRPRAVVYARSATSGHNGEVSIARQIESCRQYAAKMGFEVVSIATDEGVSGFSDEASRAGLRAVIQDAELKKFNFALVESVDRLSRDMSGFNRIHQTLKRFGVAVMGPDAGWIEQFARFLARDDRAIHLKRMALGRAAAKRKREEAKMNGIRAVGPMAK